MKSTRIFLCALALLMPPTASADQPAPSVLASIERDGPNFVYRLENNSQSVVHVPDVTISSPQETGYWLILYDPETKKTQEAWAALFQTPRRLRTDIPRMNLAPGQRLERTFSNEELLGYFQYIPKCFSLVAVYRKKWNNVMLSSGPSKPVHVCEKDLISP